MYSVNVAVDDISHDSFEVAFLLLCQPIYTIGLSVLS